MNRKKKNLNSEKKILSENPYPNLLNDEKENFHIEVKSYRNQYSQ